MITFYKSYLFQSDGTIKDNAIEPAINEDVIFIELEKAKKWFRILHNYNINIFHLPFNQKFAYSVTSGYNLNNGTVISYSFKHHSSYEEASQYAIEECIKLIKQ